jgi:hypothetical protein
MVKKYDKNGKTIILTLQNYNIVGEMSILFPDFFKKKEML